MHTGMVTITVRYLCLACSPIIPPLTSCRASPVPLPPCRASPAPPPASFPASPPPIPPCHVPLPPLYSCRASLDPPFYPLQASEFWELGLEPYTVSAISGTGTGELLDALCQVCVRGM